MIYTASLLEAPWWTVVTLERKLLLLPLATLLFLVALGVAVSAGDGPEPMVERPSGNGPMLVGHIETSFWASTKSYETMLRIYYPADAYGPGALPDSRGAPYMTVVWFPHFGGGSEAMGPQCEQLASWGAVVVAYGVHWEDMEASGNADDMNDLLDLLEEWNSTSNHTLYGMVDQEAYGVCGYSSGGGTGLITGALVPRIKAIQSWAAAIYNAAVDGIAPYFNGRPLLLQVGKDDEMYIEGSERAYKKVGPPCILVETHNAQHGGPFQDHMYIAFYLYHLQGKEEYFTFLYGDEAVDLVAEDLADVFFKLTDDHFFPPKVTTTVSPLTVPMDAPVSLEATIHGYQFENESQLVRGWDVNRDGLIDVMLNNGTNTTHTFILLGPHEVQFHYELNMFIILGKTHYLNVTNVVPVAVAGSDMEVEHDGYLQLDGGASWDSPTDDAHLLFTWEFSDGTSTDTSPDPLVTRYFREVGVLTATLTVRDPHGAEATDSINITVVNVPPNVTTVDSLSVVEDGILTLDGTGNDTQSHAGLLVYRWDFGDGIRSDWMATSRANHSYTRSGEYTTTLTVKDPEGATASASINVTVLNIAPEGVIELPVNGTEVDKGEPVEFLANGTDTPSDEVYLTFMWSFGDGLTTDWLGRRDTRVTHVYGTAGTFLIMLTVKDTDGATATDTHSITVVNTPPEGTIVRPWPSAGVLEDTRVVFLGEGTDTPDDQDGLSYMWVIEGAMYTGDRVEHTFTKSGVYEAVFHVTDPDGATVHLSVTVTVENVVPEATVASNATRVEVGDAVHFSLTIYDTASDAGTHVVKWDFGDGGTGEGVETDHIFQSNGTYRVFVTVEDDDGDTAVASVSLTVTDPPAGPVEPTDGNGPSTTDGDGMSYLAIAAVIVVILVAVLLVVFFLKGKEMTGTVDEDEDGDPGH